MILNERQYLSSVKKLRETDENMAHLSTTTNAVSTADRRVALASLGEFAKQLRQELAEYEALRSGSMPILPLEELGELPLALIRARIAQQLTQAQLADRLHMKEQQLQRYEMTRYAGANLERLKEIAQTLGVRIQGSAIVEPPVTHHDAVWRKPLILMTVAEIEGRWNRPTNGALELQKMLVNVDTGMRAEMSFHAFDFEPYKYGPFDPFIEDDVERLVALDLMAKRIRDSSIRGDEVLVAEFRVVPLLVTSKAHKWITTFLTNDKVATQSTKAQVLGVVRRVVADYGALTVPDLMARTYAEHPEYTTRSVLKEDMARRSRGGR